MRNWYKNNFENENGRKKSKILYYLIPLYLVLILWYGKDFRESFKGAEPVVISKKLSTSFVEKDLIEKLHSYENGTENITYVVASRITNNGNDGFIQIDASLLRKDEKIDKSETLFIKNSDTIDVKFYFDVVSKKNSKRRYNLQVVPVRKNKDLSKI